MDGVQEACDILACPLEHGSNSIILFRVICMGTRNEIHLYKESMVSIPNKEIFFG